MNLCFQYLLWLPCAVMTAVQHLGTHWLLKHICLEQLLPNPLYRTNSTLRCGWISSDEQLASYPFTTVDWDQKFDLAIPKHELYSFLTIYSFLCSLPHFLCYMIQVFLIISSVKEYLTFSFRIHSFSNGPLVHPHALDQTAGGSNVCQRTVQPFHAHLCCSGFCQRCTHEH